MGHAWLLKLRRYLKNANAIFPLKIDDFGAFLRDLPKMKLNVGKEEVEEVKEVKERKKKTGKNCECCC